ncbi:MAG: hypothetical protein U1F43_28390 [Myxococcota bacterium]
MRQTLEFVLQQSSGGHHHLFDPALVRSSFAAAGRVDRATVDGACALLDGLRETEDLEAQRRFIGSSPEPVQRLFVRLYFDYLSGFMARRGVVYH